MSDSAAKQDKANAAPGEPLLRWPIWFAAIPLMLAAVAVTHAAWADIVHIAWTDEESSHILLVPVVFAWLVWVYRHRLDEAPLTWTLWGPAILIAAWAFSTYGYIRAHQVFWHFGALLSVFGCLVSVVGWTPIRRLWPAFLVLMFLLPVPGRIRQEIALPMQNIAAQVTEGLLTIIGIEVSRAGNLLSIKGTEVNIAEACNGLRMVMALFLVSYTFAFVNPLRPWVRGVLIATSPVLAIVGNVMRLAPTVWVYGNLSDDTAKQLHDLFGWAMLVVAYFLLMGVVGLLRWAYLPVTDEAEAEKIEPTTNHRGQSQPTRDPRGQSSNPPATARTAQANNHAEAERSALPAGK